MSATDNLLNAKFHQLERDAAELANVRAWIAEREEREAAARALLAEMDGAREFAGVLARIVERAQAALEEARVGTDWQPRREEPTPIGDAITRTALTTLESPTAPDDPDALQHLTRAEVSEAATG